MQIENTLRDGRSDFVFIVGCWQVKNRRLRERLRGSQDWEEFDGVSVARPVLGGLGNIDEITIERESGRLEGLTLRLYDPKAQQWSIYWADNIAGILFTPMIGGFTNGIGEFYAHEVFQDKHVLSRFIWSGITETSCHWEQALSTDGGKNWETNWTMDFTRST